MRISNHMQTGGHTLRMTHGHGDRYMMIDVCFDEEAPRT